MTTSPTRSLVLTAAAAGLLTACLSACAPLVLGGVAAGAMIAADRRTAGIVVED